MIIRDCFLHEVLAEEEDLERFFELMVLETVEARKSTELLGGGTLHSMFASKALTGALLMALSGTIIAYYTGEVVNGLAIYLVGFVAYSNYRRSMKSHHALVEEAVPMRAIFTFFLEWQHENTKRELQGEVNRSPDKLLRRRANKDEYDDVLLHSLQDQLIYIQALLYFNRKLMDSPDHELQFGKWRIIEPMFYSYKNYFSKEVMEFVPDLFEEPETNSNKKRDKVVI